MQVPDYSQFADEMFYNPPMEPLWVRLAFPVILIVILVPFLIWVLRFLKGAGSQTSTAIDVTQVGIDVTREAIEVQRETNRLLTELNETLKQRPE